MYCVVVYGKCCIGFVFCMIDCCVCCCVDYDIWCDCFDKVFYGGCICEVDVVVCCGYYFV